MLGPYRDVFVPTYCIISSSLRREGLVMVFPVATEEAAIQDWNNWIYYVCNVENNNKETSQPSRYHDVNCRQWDD